MEICTYFKITLAELNAFIIGYELKENDVVKNLFPKTKIQLNLFILTRSYKLVIIVLGALAEDTFLSWKNNWIKNYKDKRIIAIDTADDTGQAREKFSLKR